MPPKMNLALAPAPAPGSPVAVPGPIYPEPAGRVINSPDRFAPSVRGDAAIDDALAASEAFAEEFIIPGANIDEVIGPYTMYPVRNWVEREEYVITGDVTENGIRTKNVVLARRSYAGLDDDEKEAVECELWELSATAQKTCHGNFSLTIYFAQV